MTALAKFEANELRMQIFESVGWRCEVCGALLLEGCPQLAHRIPKTKGNLEKYGKAIIHHRFNLVAVESLACNSAVNIGGHPGAIFALVDRIRGDLHDKGEI